MLRKFLLIFLALIIFPTCAAANPVRIARLPIIFRSNVPDYDTRVELETKIARAAHIPMNKTLQVAYFIPTEESSQVLSDIWQEIRAENKKAKIQDAIRPFADKINADIVICPILLDYRQYVNGFSSFGETYIHSDARAELIVYDRRTDNLIDKKASQFYHDVISTTGSVDYLAKICFDKVIDQTNLRKLIMSVGK